MPLTTSKSILSLSHNYLILYIVNKGNLHCRYMVDDKYNLGVTAQFIYFTFLILVSLILMNLLIGLAVNDIQGLQTEGRVKRLRKQAEFIVYLEDMTTNRFLLWLLCCTSLKESWKSWLNLQSTFTVKPYGRSDKKSKFFLSPRIVERAVAIVQDGRIPMENSSANETYDILSKCLASIELLSQRMEHLEHGLLGSSMQAPIEESRSSNSINQRDNASASAEQFGFEDEEDEESDASTDQFDFELPDRLMRVFNSEEDVDESRRMNLRKRKRDINRSLFAELQDIRQLLANANPVPTSP